MRIVNIIRKRKKRSNLLMVELGLSFLVLFILFSFIIKYMLFYLQPLGYNYSHVYALTIDNWSKPKNEKERLQIFNLLKKEILSFPEVQGITNCAYVLPFTSSYAGTALDTKNNQSIQTQMFKVDDDFAKVMDIHLIEGRWFNRDDYSPDEKTIIIDQKLQSALFGNGPVVGKEFSSGKDKYKIIGVYSQYKKDGEFQDPNAGCFERFNPAEPREELLIKVKPGTGKIFESKLMRVAGTIAKDWTLNMQTLEKMHTAYLRRTLTPFVLLSILSLFLIGNTVLGQFSVLWYNISLRKSEIGLRMAVGANKMNIYRQFIGEMLTLATLGIVPGLIIAAQFPILKVFEVKTGVYLIAMLISALIIYLLVILCALLPSAQAAKIQPAMALHEE